MKRKSLNTTHMVVKETSFHSLIASNYDPFLLYQQYTLNGLFAFNGSNMSLSSDFSLFNGSHFEDHFRSHLCFQYICFFRRIKVCFCKVLDKLLTKTNYFWFLNNY